MNIRLIDAYIAKTIWATIGLVTLALVGLQLFVLFVNELDSIGRGDYRVGQAFIYVLLNVPYQTYLFFPVACLLGCLVGLGLLASNNELTVVRASGMSIGQIILIVFKAAVPLIILVAVLGETVIPNSMRYAEQRKAIATSSGQTLPTRHGIWLRDQQSLVRIGAVIADDQLRRITQYQFDAQLQLVLVRYAQRATRQEHQWVLQQVVESYFEPDQVTVVEHDQIPWALEINPHVLGSVEIEPEMMTLPQLRHYILDQRGHQLRTAPYELAYWKRLTQPLAALVMLFLAIPFIFGPLRTASASYRLVVGAIVGFSFYMLDKFFGPFSLVYQFPPLFAAIMPTLLFTILGFILLRKAK